MIWTQSIKKYGHQIVKNAKTLAAGLMGKGYNLVTGGTDNHLLLIDLTNKNIIGAEAETALSKAGITVNKILFHSIPGRLLAPAGLDLEPRH